MAQPPTAEAFNAFRIVERDIDYRKSTKIVPASFPPTPGAHDVYVRMRYLGINASDMVYIPNPANPIPREWGFEGIGVVEKVGADVSSVKVNDPVGFLSVGAFAEFVCVPDARCIKLPALNPEFMDIILSGMTSAIAIGEKAQPKKGDVALVTAAAGGAGHIAVQLLKHHYGCTVIGTCSSSDKTAFLQELGCDHVLNYRTDDIDARLTELAPKGLNVVYDGVGGELFHTALRHAAVRARVVVIGHISDYKSGQIVPWKHPSGVTLSSFLLTRSISVRYFHLSLSYAYMAQYVQQMLEEYAAGRLSLHVDHTKSFKGLAAVHDALDHLYSGTSFGKVVVEL